MSIKVISVRRGWFYHKVRFKANKLHEYHIGTFIGDKTFYMNDGDEVTLQMSKDDMWEIGDKVKSLGSLVTVSNQTKFYWDWSYNR